MSQRSDVPPATLGVEIEDGTVEVAYLDGRRVTYRVPPQSMAGRHGPDGQQASSTSRITQIRHP